jgi:hypothetical protein
MGVLSWFKGKQTEAAKERTQHSFDDEDRRASAVIRRARQEAELSRIRMEQEINNLRLKQEQIRLQQDIEDMMADDDEDYDNDDKDLQMMRMFKPAIDALSRKIAPEYSPNKASSLSQVSENPPSKEDLSNEELKQIWSMTPKLYRDRAKTFSDSQIKIFVSSQFPNWSDDTISRAVAIVRA